MYRLTSSLMRVMDAKLAPFWSYLTSGSNQRSPSLDLSRKPWMENLLTTMKYWAFVMSDRLRRRNVTNLIKCYSRICCLEEIHFRDSSIGEQLRERFTQRWLCSVRNIIPSYNCSNALRCYGWKQKLDLVFFQYGVNMQ